jgi:DNA repair protein RadA/Sms
MAKAVFACTQCGSQAPKWSGQCGDCGKWNTLVEETIAPVNRSRKSEVGYAGGQASQPTVLAEVELARYPRLSSGQAELDRVLGGGLVPGSVVLIGGDPGIGKSTLLLQTLCKLSQQQRALYVTGEESMQQVALRANRLGLPVDSLIMLTETHVERIMQVTHTIQPQIMVIDSIQTVFTDSLTSAPGSVSQVRESTAALVRFAKQQHIALFIVGHVTKEGALAGPRVLEHMVDTVLYFEGDTDSRFRLLRAIKNRFGAVNELGIFAMTERGLREVSNPSAIFLTRGDEAVSGSAIVVTWEGSRPLLVEVQALVDRSHLQNPRRVTVGLEPNRLAILLAVLNQHGGVATYDQDVFVNVVGGVRVNETAADLAVILAVLSSLRNRPLPQDMVILGEVGLGGEIRPVPRGLERLSEAAKHGFKRALVPKANAPKPIEGIEVIPVQHLSQALASV